MPPQNLCFQESMLGVSWITSLDIKKTWLNTEALCSLNSHWFNTEMLAAGTEIIFTFSNSQFHCIIYERNWRSPLPWLLMKLIIWIQLPSLPDFNYGGNWTESRNRKTFLSQFSSTIAGQHPVWWEQMMPLNTTVPWTLDCLWCFARQASKREHKQACVDEYTRHHNELLQHTSKLCNSSNIDI